MTMSHGYTDLGAHMSTLRMTSVVYTVAASFAANYQDRQLLDEKETIPMNRFTYLLDHRVIRRCRIIFDTVN